VIHQSSCCCLAAEVLLTVLEASHSGVPLQQWPTNVSVGLLSTANMAALLVFSQAAMQRCICGPSPAWTGALLIMKPPLVTFGLLHLPTKLCMKSPGNKGSWAELALVALVLVANHNF
jgi:hypothetical protein